MTLTSLLFLFYLKAEPFSNVIIDELIDPSSGFDTNPLNLEPSLLTDLKLNEVPIDSPRPEPIRFKQHDSTNSEMFKEFKGNLPLENDENS